MSSVQKLEDMPRPTGPRLLSQFRLRDVSFRNRVVLSPMQVYQATPDGLADDWHLQHLGKFAVGGFGCVVTEGLIVDPVGRATWGDLGIWSDDQIAPLRRITDFVRGAGAVPAAQLHHAGPKAARQRPWEGFGPLTEVEAARGEPAWVPVSSSADRSAPGWHMTREMTLDDIQAVTAAYGAAARRADAAGFDVIDIHAAHGYLLHSFLSPVANRRTDGYGGDIDGRMRLLLEIAETLRANWPEGKAIFFRISCVDWRADIEEPFDGWTIEDSCRLTRELHRRGVDLIDCSSGGIRGATSMSGAADRRTGLKRGFQVPYAAAIRRETGVPTMAVGVILDGEQAEGILEREEADLIAIGRAALFDPHWVLHAARDLGADADWSLWPPSYGWWLAARERIGIAPERA